MRQEKAQISRAKSYAQSDQNLFLNLFDYKATDRQAFDVSKLEKETAQARLSLFMLECHIVGSHN